MFFCVGFVLLIGCKDKSKTCSVTKTVSFKNDVQPILNENCTTSGCHSGVKPAANLSLVDTLAYKYLLDSKSGYVVPGDYNASGLYVSIKSVSNPMPPNGNMDVCKIETIKVWIQQGGLNN